MERNDKEQNGTGGHIRNLCPSSLSLHPNMKKTAPRQVLLLPLFNKFINASATGRRRQPSGKRVSKDVVEQYRIVSRLIAQFEYANGKPLNIRLMHRATLRQQQKEARYWYVFYRTTERLKSNFYLHYFLSIIISKFIHQKFFDSSFFV